MCCATGRRWCGRIPPVIAQTHTWLLDNQKRVVVPDWESSATCLSAGLCVGMVPSHFARPWIDRGEWTALALENPFPDAACCLTWQQSDASPALSGCWIIWGTAKR
jgi:DNA-binding transcriptional LysR family regulator